LLLGALQSLLVEFLLFFNPGPLSNVLIGFSEWFDPGGTVAPVLDRAIFAATNDLRAFIAEVMMKKLQ
jgi:hypothetical protein